MTRVVSIVNMPHIGYSRILKDGSENYDQRSYEGIKAIWKCELKVYVQHEDDDTLDYFSVQYDNCLRDETPDELYLRPIDYIDLKDVEEFIKAHCLVDKMNQEEATEYVVDVLRSVPSAPMSREVREKYGIPKPFHRY